MKAMRLVGDYGWVESLSRIFCVLFALSGSDTHVQARSAGANMKRRSILADRTGMSGEDRG